MTRFVATAAGACACAYIVGVRAEATWLGVLAGCLALVLLGWLGNVRDERPEEPRRVTPTVDFFALLLPLGTWILVNGVLEAGVAAALTTAGVAAYAAFKLQTTTSERA